MKKYLFFLSMLILAFTISVTSTAQSLGGKNSVVEIMGGAKIDSAFRPPVIDTSKRFAGIGPSHYAELGVNKNDSLLYFLYRGSWAQVFTSVTAVPVVTSVVSSVDLTSQTTATTVATYAVTSTADFQVSSYLTVKTVTTDVINVRVTWTDDDNNSQTINGSSLSTTGYYNLPPLLIRAKIGTNIVVATILTVSSGSMVYFVGERIIKL